MKWLGPYGTLLVFSLVLATGIAIYFFVGKGSGGDGYYDEQDGQIVFGYLGIFYAFCWGFAARYTHLAKDQRGDIPWLVRVVELITAWTSQGFLIFQAAAMLNEKILRPVDDCTDSRLSTPIIATVSFLAASVTLAEPARINSLVLNMLFLVAVVVREYKSNTKTLYGLMLSMLGVFFVVIAVVAWYARKKRKVDPNAKVSRVFPSIIWELCHHINISWAVVFSLYYMVQGWEWSLNLHERYYWIPLSVGAGAAVGRLLLTRLYWSYASGGAVRKFTTAFNKSYTKEKQQQAQDKAVAAATAAVPAKATGYHMRVGQGNSRDWVTTRSMHAYQPVPRKDQEDDPEDPSY